MIIVKKITLTPADIFALFVTPQIILPAPAAGFVNNIFGITNAMIYNSATYTGMGFFFYYCISIQFDAAFYENFIFAQSFNMTKSAQKSQQAQTLFSTTSDFLLTTDGQAATGDSNIDLFIVYETLPIS